MNSLKDENQSLRRKLEDPSLLREEFVKKILQNDSSVKHFLGLPSLAFFMQFITFVSTLYNNISFWKGGQKSGQKCWQEKNYKKPGQKRKLSIKEEFILVMLKFRLALDNVTLSKLFDVSVGHVSSLFSTWMNFLSQILSSTIKWPSRQKIKRHMPLCFKIKYPETVAIIDCTEVFVQKPKNSGP